MIDWDALDEVPFCGVPAVVGSKVILLWALNRRNRGIDRLEALAEEKERLFDRFAGCT